MRRVILAGILGIAMLFVGCSSKSPEAKEVAQDTIQKALESKKEWKIHSFKLKGSTEVLAFEKEYSFNIGFKGKEVFGVLGCNNFFGSYGVEGDKLKISNAGMTRKMCEPRIMELESKLTQSFLNSENRVEVLEDGKILIFSEEFYLLIQ